MGARGDTEKRPCALPVATQPSSTEPVSKSISLSVVGCRARTRGLLSLLLPVPDIPIVVSHPFMRWKRSHGCSAPILGGGSGSYMRRT